MSGKIVVSGNNVVVAPIRKVEDSGYLNMKISARNVHVAGGQVAASEDLDIDERYTTVWLGTGVHLSRFQVTYVFNDRTVDVRYYREGEEPEFLPLDLDDGQIFNGWDGDFSPISEDRVMTADISVQTFTVTYVMRITNPITNDITHENISIETLEYGDRPNLPSNPSDPALRFIRRTVPPNSITRNEVVYYDYEMRTVDVTFLDFYNGVISVQTILIGGDASYPTDVGNYPNMYVHSGWSRSAENITTDTTINAVFDEINLNVVIKYQGIPFYMINLDAAVHIHDKAVDDGNVHDAPGVYSTLPDGQQVQYGYLSGVYIARFEFIINGQVVSFTDKLLEYQANITGCDPEDLLDESDGLEINHFDELVDILNDILADWLNEPGSSDILDGVDALANESLDWSIFGFSMSNESLIDPNNPHLVGHMMELRLPVSSNDHTYGNMSDVTLRIAQPDNAEMPSVFSVSTHPHWSGNVIERVPYPNGAIMYSF